MVVNTIDETNEIEDDGHVIFVDDFLPAPIAVQPRDDYRIWVRYADGVEGEIDLSYLADKQVFKSWDVREFFETVFINEEGGCVCWGVPGGDMELDPETGYATLLGVSRKEIQAFSSYDAFIDAVNKIRAERGIV